MPYGMSIFWLCVTIGLAVLEGATMGLVAIWFAVGALFAMIASIAGLGLWLQIFIFLGGSAIMLYFTKPLAKKFNSTKKVKTNADRVISMEALVTERIDNAQAKGQVRVVQSGQIWTARSEDGLPIEEGQLVRVNSISGVKVIVEKIN